MKRPVLMLALSSTLLFVALGCSHPHYYPPPPPPRPWPRAPPSFNLPTAMDSRPAAPTAPWLPSVASHRAPNTPAPSTTRPATTPS